MRSDDGRSVLSRVVGILRAFGTAGEELTATEISQLAGLPISTCHRILSALVEEGLLERGADHRYHVGLVLWEVASHAPRSVGVQRIALPYMRDLFDITHYPVHLAIREGLQAVFIERLAPVDASSQRPRIGARYPLHVTSVGLMLLAHAPARVQDEFLASPLRAYTPRTVTDPLRLRRTLAEIRTRGFAVSDRQVVMDAISVAAPIRDQDGDVVAAISVNTPLGRLREQSMAHAVQTAALGITRSWRRGPAQPDEASPTPL
ncbi:IclR family transcriptional regulator [Arthrobacter halodurans]|uniref:IclR family transcriptional regulator n=1 Tax=Arthrobacter halodurans TaxID=516699 RepID=A0ABV4UQU4_9MICC